MAELRAAADERARRAELERVRVEGEQATAAARALERRKRRRLLLWAAAALVVAALGGLGAVLAVQQHANAELIAKNVAERQAKEQAQQRLAQIEKGVELFAGLLQGVNPRNEELGGPPLYEQLRQRAVKAADELVGEAVGDPEAVARIQTLLGHLLYELGATDKAVEVLERARTTRQELLGADDPRTLETLDALAVAYLKAGKQPEAMALGEQVRDARLKQLGADHLDTLATEDNLAQAYSEAGKMPEAIALFKQVRDGRVKQLGADHPDTLTTLAGLAMAYWNAGKLPEVITLLEQVRDGRVKKLGADHPDTLRTLTNLAVAYRNAGRLSEAIALYQQVGDVQVKKLGADHPGTLATRHNLAVAYLNADRLPEAITLLEQVRDARVRKLGPDHPATFATLNALGSAYMQDGKLAKAIALLKDVVDAHVKKLGADHPSTLISVCYLAKAYQDAGNLAQALPLFAQAAAGVEKRRFRHPFAGATISDTCAAYEQAKQFGQAEAWRRKWLAAVKEQSGMDSAAYAGALAGLGQTLFLQKRWPEAEATLQESLALGRKIEPDVWSTFSAASLLGGVLLGQKRYAAAEPLLLQGYEGMKRRPKKTPPDSKARLSEAADRLIALYEALGRADQVAKWRKERQDLEATAAPKATKKI
ncbi:MAG: tetratricopeptide repeat protein [Chloroflexi bacterium]|nr:tetratricopeptide repeat protein [Chloroflexota bacterium]